MGEENPSKDEHKDSPEEEILALKRRISELEEQVAVNNGLRTVGLVAAMTAHDLNNQLTVVIAFIELLTMHETVDEERIEEVSEKALKAATSAAILVRELLVIGRINRAKHERLDLHGFLQEYRREFGQLMEPGQRLQIRINPGVPHVYVNGNREQLVRLVMNLLINSCQAGARHIEVSIGSECSGDCCPGPATCFLPSKAVLRIKDDGEGMDEETRNHIFDPFFTTKKSGTGLGMVIIQSIVEAHRGVVQVDSTLGDGTTITICLPSTETPTPWWRRVLNPS